MSRRPPVRSAALSLAALLALVACGRAPTPPVRPAGAAERIVVMAPGAAEMLAALGAGDRVVGVGDWVQWPADLAARPRVGGYDSPNLERVLALRPDLYVTSEGVAGQAALATLRRLGVRTLELDTARLAGTLAAIERLGAEVGRAAPARRLVGELQGELDRLRARTAAAPLRRVLCVVGREPLYVAGPGSFLDDLIAIAGGRNVAADTGQPYSLLSLESALERQPEVILDTSDNDPAAPRGRILGAWAQWPRVPAVAARRVYAIDPERLTIPGPRLAAMATLVAQAIHPEIFGEPAPAEMLRLSPPSP